MNIFFDFRSELRSSTVQAHLTDINVNELNLIKGDYNGVNFPLKFEQKYGKYLHDILNTGFPGFYLISERMKGILEMNQLTGWRTFPIKLYDKKDNEIIGYHGFSIVGRCGPTSYKKSEIIEKRLVPNGPLCKYYRGIFIDKWDGSDFFTPDGTYETFITKRAVDILKKNKITNMYLESLTNIEIDVHYIKK